MKKTGEDFPNGEYSELIEFLAKTAHDNWSDQNPQIVEFEKLSEYEKNYCRNTTRNILKNVLEIGYDVSLSSEKLDRDGVCADDFLLSYLSKSSVSLDELRSVWSRHDSGTWSLKSNLYQIFAKKVLSYAEPLLAYDVTQEGLTHFPDDVKLRQLHALSLIRIGLGKRANNILLELYNEGEKNDETLGLLASTHKEMSILAKDEKEKIREMELAIRYYREAYENSGSIWSGINLATTQAISGDMASAKDAAGEIKRKVLDELCGQEGDSYWSYATIGEASIILQDFSEALKWYKKACELGEQRLGDLISTRKNLRLLFSTFSIPDKIKEELDLLFNIPKVVVFTGHMVDRLEDDRIRFPQEIEKAVKSEIEKKMDEIGNCITYSSAACGADILFLETVIQRNAKVNVVLPCEIQKFIESSVGYLKQSNWEARFGKILRSSVKTFEITKHTSEFMDIPYDYANHVLYGFALIHARHMQTELIPMAVCDKNSERKEGGTATVVDNWQNRGHQVEIIDLADILRKNVTLKTKQVLRTKTDIPETTSTKKYKSEVMGLLFADTVNYSRLSDDEMIIFGEKLLGLVGEILKDERFKVAARNSWGDALFLVFPRIEHAGLFALEFVERIANIDWASEGISKQIKLRTALHAGMVYNYKSPITRDIVYSGTNICRVARMESITPPGQVFCSLEFASLAEAYHIGDFICNYVGQISMPKEFGIFPTYHVRRN